MLTLLLLLAGCAQTTQQISVRPKFANTQTENASPLVNTDSGLHIHKWVMPDPPGRVANAMWELASDALPPDRSAQLRRNGFRFWRLPLSQLESLQGTLGEPTVNAAGWHGQVFDWRAVHEHRLNDPGAVLAIDGRVRRYAGGGGFALMIRSWTVQMEDGLYLQLELSPMYRQLPKPGDLRRLLGEKEDEVERFSSMSFELLLEPETVYVLTGEAPDTEWDGTNIGKTDDGDRAVGPDVQAPPTLGELLLQNNETTPRRGLLVFLPSIPHQELTLIQEPSVAQTPANVDEPR